MRRGRNLREYREKVLQERAKSLQPPSRLKKTKRSFKDILKKRKNLQSLDFTVLPSNKSLSLSGFKNFDQYIPSKNITVCHVIESMGLGGAQTMMLELINGLAKYYQSNVRNLCVLLSRRNPDKNIYESYGIDFDTIKHSEFKQYCNNNNVDVIVHHRIAISSCLKQHLPVNVKYILINHTWHNMAKMEDFIKCDAYVSVCQFLHNKTAYPEFIHDTRKIVILNGVENDYINSIEKIELQGQLKTGRCHRIVPSKFNIDSIQWMRTVVLKSIAHFSHYLIGNSREVKALAKKYNFLHYMGSIIDRYEKMALIKSLDVYFYETFQDEGASVAILESLASGVPVLCKNLGGCGELVKNGLNGFIVKDRSEFLLRLQQLNRPDYLLKMKEQTKYDFESRLHIKHVACKYMQLFEALINADSTNNR